VVGIRKPEDSARTLSGTSVVDLVEAARNGDHDAWGVLVTRYAPLVWSICRRFGLRRNDTDDVAQGVWMALLEHLASLRQPAALPGWIATITRRECMRVLRGQRNYSDADAPVVRDVDAEGEFNRIDRDLERAWENAILREALSDLRPLCRELLTRLFRDEQPSYRDVANDLQLKVGSIGPTRQRCLEEIRRSPAFAVLRNAGRDTGDWSAPG
jgi:RNA polymerase sigma factor (sigma-70 family)